MVGNSRRNEGELETPNYEDTGREEIGGVARRTGLCSSEVSFKAMKKLLEKKEVGMIVGCSMKGK